MAKVPENFMMQRRMNGMDAYLPASDIAPGDVADSTNLYSYDGEWYSRWGKQACFVTPPSSNPNYAATEFLRSDGSTVIVFCNDGKLYFTVAGTPPLAYTEITINGSSFTLDSANVQMKKAGLYLYVIDGSGPLYRILVNADGTFTSSECTALSVPDAPSAALTNTIIDDMTSASNWVSFPALSWGLAGVSVNGATNAKTITSSLNQQFSGGGTSPSETAPYPTGWLDGGDTQGYQSEPSTEGSGNEILFGPPNSGVRTGPYWVDWDYPTPNYPAGQNTINTARVWVATAAGHSSVGGSFQMAMFPEDASVSEQSFTTSITAASNASPIVITAAGHALRSGQAVQISGVGGNTAANTQSGQYWYVNVLSTSTFAIYQDAALTLPVSGTANYTSGGTVTCTGAKAFTDLQIISVSTNSSTVSSAAHPFVSGDANKVLTIFSGPSGITPGNYTITSVNGSNVATVNGNIGNTGTGVVAILGLDSGGAEGHGNVTLQNPDEGALASPALSGLGVGQASSPFKCSASVQTFSQVFSWSALSDDFDYIKFRLQDQGPGQLSTGVGSPSLQVVDVRLIPTAAPNGLHLASNNPVGLGANCLGGVWIKRDYTGTKTSYTDLAISGSNKSEVTSSGHPFTSANVGQVLTVISSTGGWTAGNYVIQSVSSGVATLSAPAATSTSATAGVGSACSAQDFSKNNVISIGWSAPSTTPQIPWRVGILKAGQPITEIIWSNLVSYSSDGASFYVDISTIDVSDADARSQCACLFLRIETDLPSTINPADLCTIGPLTGAGNLSIGLADYYYVGVAVQDFGYSTSGGATTDTVDGIVLSNPSGPTTQAITPTNYQAQAYVTFDSSYYSASGNSEVNWLWVYRFGGALAGANVTTYTSYILLDQCPRWSGTSTSPPSTATISAAGGVGGGSWTWNGTVWQSSDGYRTWNPLTFQLEDNTPDLALIGNDFLNDGRNPPPEGASAIELWNNRLVLALGSTLYISDLLSTNSAAALYYASTVDSEDPYAVTKGGIYPVEANDNDNIVQIKTHGQYLDIFKQKSVFLLTGQDPVSGFQITPHLKDAGIGLVGGPQAVCAYDLNVAFVGPSAVHEYKAEPVHFSFGILQAYEDAEQAPILSQKIEPLIAPYLKGGRPIAPSAYRNMVLHYQGRRLWLFAPAPGGSTNSVAYVFDTRPATDGSGQVGWTRLTPFNIVSCCSLSSQSDSDDLYMGGADGQIYKLTGDADISSLRSITAATNASPIVITANGHGYSNGEYVLVTGVGGNTAANGNWYAGSVTTNTFALYQDAGLSQTVVGNGTYTTSTGATGSLTPISWNVTSRGFMNETNDFRYFKANRPTRAYFLVSTNESAELAFGVSVVGGTGGSGEPASFSTTYTINGQFTDVRFKVPAEVRGYGAVQVSVSGSTSTQSRVTAFGVEDAKGAIRGNV